MNKENISPFSRLKQIGVVVNNLDKTVNFLSSLGLGPFQPPQWPVSVYIEEWGKPAKIKSKTLFLFMGDIEIEFIEPQSESIQMDFLRIKGEGLHHLGFLVDDIDYEIKRMVKEGLNVMQCGRREKGGGYAYLDTDKYCGIIFELIQR